MAALVAGLVVAAILLAPWQLKFAVDARDLYSELYEQAAREAQAETLGWLAAAGYGYQALREENVAKAHDVLAVGQHGSPHGRADARLADLPGGTLSAWRRSRCHPIRSSRPPPRSASRKAAVAHLRGPGPHRVRANNPQRRRRAFCASARYRSARGGALFLRRARAPVLPRSSSSSPS